MTQNTLEWLSYRHGKLGASDAPIIMGESPYMTRYQLWRQKTMPFNPDENKTNFAAQLGSIFEPKILNRFCLEQGLDAQPEIFQHKEVDYLSASLDGYIEKTNQCIEIKYVGKDKFNWIKENQKPLDIHYAQCQHQFLVSGAHSGFYIAYTLTPDRKQIDEVVTIRTEADNKYMTDVLFPALKEFWDLVKSGKPPEPTAKDIAELDDLETKLLVEQYTKLSNDKKAIETTLKLYEDQLKSKALSTGRDKVKAFNLTMTTVVKKGSVDYDKIPELKNVDLEKYRKKASSYVMIKAGKITAD